VGRGVCPYAAAILEAAAAGIPAAAVVLATTCDQVRRIADLVGRDAHLPMFLLNVPATWQTPAARALYAEEIERLGRFLLSLGGVRPTAGQLTEVMLRYQRARTVAVAARNRMPARRFAETLIAARSSGQAPSEPVEHCAAADSGGPPGRVPLALLGGPLVRQDYDLFDLVERAGGSIVLDASEGGCRTLPAPFDTRQMAADPLTALGAAYFGIPDVFRRPNDPLHQWLGRELPAHGVRGIIFRRYVWCDLWHAELHRLKQSSPVPLLEIDVADDDRPVASRTEARIEAFLEMLR
jgi:benzoyl-CoA reductase/2-hydroxyglutaryl-CoA dehydratase subunit BcrC/BadD/HgdB